MHGEGKRRRRRRKRRRRKTDQELLWGQEKKERGSSLRRKRSWFFFGGGGRGGVEGMQRRLLVLLRQGQMEQQELCSFPRWCNFFWLASLVVCCCARGRVNGTTFSYVRTHTTYVKSICVMSLYRPTRQQASVIISRGVLVDAAYPMDGTSVPSIPPHLAFPVIPPGDRSHGIGKRIP